MPTERPGRPRIALPLMGLLAGLLALGAPARAFTPASGSGTGGFASPFPDAGSPASGAGTGGTGGTAGGGTTAATGLAPPDYRFQDTAPLVMGGLPVPGFTVAPTIRLDEEFNDNIFQTETNRRADLITVLSPGITVTANTPRLDLSLQYAPSLEYYARTPSENTIAQQLFAVASLIVVPDTFFVDAAAYATVTPTNGGFLGAGAGGAGFGGYGYGAGTAGFTRQSSSQVFGETLTPYLVHRFGQIGTANLGVAFAHTSASNTIGGGNTDLTSADLTGQFQSGPVLGRFQDTVSLEAYRAAGTGLFANASRETIQDQLGYALFRRLQVFGALGYEDIAYGGSGAAAIHDITWKVGFSATPGPRSAITLSYGHDQGSTGFSGQASYALTARTSVAASYTRGVTTYLQQVAAALGQAGVNQNGVAVNAVTGLPLAAVNGTLIVQNSVSEVTTLDVTLTTLLDRDTVALSFDRTTDTPLSGAGGFTQDATTETASWTHLLNPRAIATGSLSYGTISVPGLTGDSTLFSLSTQFRYTISPTISSSASYLFFRRRSTTPGFSVYDNVVFVGITKRF